MATLLISAPASWGDVWVPPLRALAPKIRLLVHECDAFALEDIDYVLSFRPPKGLLRSLPRLKAAFSMGAGVDGFFVHGDYPAHVPLVRLVDHALARDMVHYIVMHVLIFHRGQRAFDAHQHQQAWRQSVLPRRAEETRIGILGLGEIGTLAAEHLHALDFSVAGWSRTRKNASGIESFAGKSEFDRFLARSDVLVCVLPLTPDTRGILNRATFAGLPPGAFVINVARGGHLVEEDLVSAVDSGHLSGAALDVFQTEPLPQSSPLWTHPAITVTPHIAAISDPRAVAHMALEGIARFERGEPLQNVVDLRRGY